MPDIREVQRGEIITKYLQDIEPLHSESSRSHAFAMILQKLLGITEPNFIDNYCTGFEHYLTARHKDRILKGRADNLFGNVIIEFENNIPKMRSEAEAQLRKYVAILWSQEAPEVRTPYLCLAGDGVRFISYSPALTDPSSARLPRTRLICTSWKKWTGRN